MKTLAKLAPRAFGAFVLFAAANTVASVATATPAPQDYFRPQSVFHRFTQELPTVGIKILPRSFVLKGLPGNRLNLHRLDGVVAQLARDATPDNSISRVGIYDLKNNPLYLLSESVLPCVQKTDGVCHALRVDTQLEEINPSVLPLTVTWSTKTPAAPQYFVAGKAVSDKAWQESFNQTVAALYRKLATVKETMALVPGMPGTPCEQVTHVIEHDPLLAPYLPHLKIVKQGDGVAIVGIVPSTAVYRLLASKTVGRGFAVDLRVSINRAFYNPKNRPLSIIFG